MFLQGDIVHLAGVALPWQPVGMQVLYAYLDVPGVAWFDHIGGFVFGFFTIYAMRKFDMLQRDWGFRPINDSI